MVRNEMGKQISIKMYMNYIFFSEVINFFSDGLYEEA